MKLLRKMLKGVSLTAAMFVFQACYGTPPDGYENYIESYFRVVSADDGSPLQDIEVMIVDGENIRSYCGSTDTNGLCCALIKEYWSNTKFRFVDRDSVYAVKDTVINKYTGDTVQIALAKVQ